MKITKIDNKQVIKLEGNIDAEVGKQLEDEILLQLGKAEKHFIIDLIDTTHISIFGMAHLVNLKTKSEELKFKIHLKNPSELIHKLLKLYHLEMF